jgi:rhamnulokinase
LDMTCRTYVAIDLGAESGRVIAGGFDGQRFELNLVHRFNNDVLRRGNRLQWNSQLLKSEITRGLERVGALSHEVCSVAVDSWGVDFGLMDESGSLIEEPHHYRDARTSGMSDRISQIVGRDALYEATGVQPQDINTLCQLYSMVGIEDSALSRARRLLFMPDLMSFFLSGEMVNELTIATTSQCLCVSRTQWALPVLDALKIPCELFGRLITPGTEIGPLRSPFKEISGFTHANVVAPACHDTASAVTAIPASTEDYAYISSGTWSLMGVLSDRPMISSTALSWGFTNEGGADGQVRLLKNITGLWLLQQCRVAWSERGLVLDYTQIVHRAIASAPTDHLFDPDDLSLKSPVDMPKAIAQLCSVEALSVDEEIGVIARAIFQSLACKYRQTLDQLQELLGRRIGTIHIVGGGSSNALLCQLTADACGVPVMAGPAETTALGNLLAQAIAGGQCRNWIETREVARRCYRPQEYLPRPDSRWAALHERFGKLSVPN